MLIRVSQDNTLPIELSDIKEHLAIDGTADDARLTDYIWAAVEYISNETNREYVETVYDEVLPSFSNRIELKRSPLASVDSVKYYDTDGTQQTLASSSYYRVLPSNLPAFIEPVTYWPAIKERPDAVTIRYTTQATTTQLETFKHCVRLLVASFNENREAEVVGTITNELKIGLQRLTDQLRNVGYC